MTRSQGVVLFLAAVLGGTLNSVAGGGSFISFPTLLSTGVPGIQANVTNTVALWPGGVAAVGGYRGKFDTPLPTLLLLVTTSLVGGLLGALLLLHTPQATFLALVPYLLLLATLLFWFGGAATTWLRARMGTRHVPRWLATGGIILLQLVIASYGGFFGGGISILMLALLAVMGMENIHTMNALKALLAACINGVAVVAFIIAGAVLWPQALLMAAGAIVGGYGGASLARRIAPKLIRRFVIVVGLSVSAYFFVSPYLFARH
jgi:hypothetical protein